nr:SurA N-terminal domain-containing protein [Alteromonas sp. IB21]
MELREAYKVTRSNVIPMVLFAAIVVSLGINTPQAANEIIARLFNTSISNSELQPSQADVDRFQSILTDKSEKEVRSILAQRALGNKITESVLSDFAHKNDIEPDDGEVQSAYSVIKQWTVELDDNSEFQGEEIERYRLAMAHGMAKSWKVSKALYEAYGGDVVFQQDNPLTPVGAYQQLFEQYREKGEFVIYDPVFKAAFWSSVKMKYAKTYDPDNIDFSLPWWEKSMTAAEK